jgi:hypothetical protein
MLKLNGKQLINSKVTKYFIDTEFIEDGKTIELISIGIVSENDEAYYAINQDCHFERASGWVMENVLNPHIGCILLDGSDGFRKFEFKEDVKKYIKTKEQIAADISSLVLPDSDPEFWANYASYDWVVFCQLFGLMIDLPKGYPMFCHDIQQEIERISRNFGLDVDLPFQNEHQKHHALYDAYWDRSCYLALPTNDYSKLAAIATKKNQ